MSISERTGLWRSQIRGGIAGVDEQVIEVFRESRSGCGQQVVISHWTNSVWLGREGKWGVEIGGRSEDE